MEYSVPVKALETGSEELFVILSKAVDQVAAVSVREPERLDPELAMDPGIVSLLIELGKAAIPAIVSAIAWAWVEHVRRKRAVETPPSKGRFKPTIVLETDAGDIRIEVDTSNIDNSISTSNLPENVQQIVRIRLE